MIENLVYDPTRIGGGVGPGMYRGINLITGEADKSRAQVLNRQNMARQIMDATG